MKRDKKFLAALIGCGVLALALVVQGVMFHQIRTEDTAALEQAGERISALTGELAQAEEAQQTLESELERSKALMTAMAGRNNQIDQYYYSEKRPCGNTTAEMSTEAAFYREAWRRELNHAVEWIASEWDATEDERAFLAEYRMQVERQAEQAADIVGMQWQRGMTGTLGAVVMPACAAEAYRQGTFLLLDAYFCSGLDWQPYYPFSFDEETVSELREEFQDPYVSGKQLFPPISEVMGGE